jgi:hypothetical protein
MLQERLFRGLHDKVCLAFGSEDATTFSMDTRGIANVRSWFKTLFAKVVVGLHGPLLVVIITVALLVNRDLLARLISCLAAIFR